MEILTGDILMKKRNDYLIFFFGNYYSESEVNVTASNILYRQDKTF